MTCNTIIILDKISEEQLKEVARILERDLHRRFRKFTDPSSKTHNPFYILATLLDPHYRLALNPVLQAAAKKYLIKEVRVQKSCRFSGF